MTAEQYIIKIQAKPENIDKLWHKLPRKERERIRKALETDKLTFTFK